MNNQTPRCGILTFHRAINYGAALQAYALCTAVNQMGVPAELIDYHCPEDKNNRIWMSKSVPKRIFKMFLMLPVCPKKARFRRFLPQNAPISPPCRNGRELAACCEQYQRVIVGSDQVFNLSLTGGDLNYFLPFLDKSKKCSYAASFGSPELPPAVMDELAPLLRDFGLLSVREQSGLGLLRQMGRPDAEAHLDPVFLLDAAQWAALAQGRPRKPYILYYELFPIPELRRYAQALSRSTGLPVLRIDDRYYRHYKGIRCLVGVGVEEFLGLFQDAEYVVTNSFHGTAFSVIFHRPFKTEARLPDGRGTRIESLVDTLGLRDRLLETDAPMDRPVDWERVERRLGEERRRARRYLKDVCGGTDEPDETFSV